MKVFTTPPFPLFFPDKPSPPQGPASVEWRTDDSLELRWVSPASDGGSALTGYIVERREVGKKSWKQVGSSGQDTHIEIRGLKKNSAYNFRSVDEGEKEGGGEE